MPYLLAHPTALPSRSCRAFFNDPVPFTTSDSNRDRLNALGGSIKAFGTDGRAQAIAFRRNVVLPIGTKPRPIGTHARALDAGGWPVKTNSTIAGPRPIAARQIVHQSEAAEERCASTQ